MSRKTQHTRFEDKILRKLANEDKPQVVTACAQLISPVRQLVWVKQAYQLFDQQFAQL